MIIVLGSINIDLTTTAAEIPKPGETVIGESFAQYAGGKGANQAVCAARLGAEVVFLGKVGNDSYGDFILREMERSGVDVSRVERCDTHTGLAAISVDANGCNCIIVVPGANFIVDTAYIERHRDAIERCDMIMAQHETPIDATEYAFKIGREKNDAAESRARRYAIQRDDPFGGYPCPQRIRIGAHKRSALRFH